MDAKQFLMGSGTPGFSFTRPGDTIVGQIVGEPTVQQQKVYGTNDPATWPSGDPKMQMLVPVTTSYRSYEGIANPDTAQPDTGARTIYVKGKHFERALREAVRATGRPFLEIGGWLRITYTGDDMTSKAGMKPKLFDVAYQAPPPGAQGGQQFPVAQAPRPPQQAHPFPAQGGYIPAAQPAGNPWGIQAPVQAAPPVPAHHEVGPPPSWAVEPSQPVSAAPAVAQAPVMSTLDALKAAQSAGPSAETPDF